MEISPAAGPTLKTMADSTPASRDRYVDLVRAFSIAVVVLGHWLMAIVYWENGAVTGENALEVVPGLWMLTWVLQVMPLFFFVGGFSNLVSWRGAQRRGDGYGAFVQGRVTRLMKPTAVFIGTWLVASLVLESLLGLEEEMRMATALLAKPLWFLGVYVIVVALAPAMTRLHERFGLKVPVAMVGFAAIVDIARIGFEVPMIGYLNFALVWLFPHQIGFFYADGSLVEGGRRLARSLTFGGFTALACLVGSGIYSPSMVGMSTDRISNNDPPTVCLIALSCWLIGIAMTLRPKLSGWLQNRKVWAGVIGANSVIMTVFLWHLTALVLAVVTVFPIGFPQPSGGSAAWWATRPVWILLLSVYLVPFVIAFGRFERPDFSGSRPGRVGGRAAVAGICLLVAGLAGFAEAGFAGLFDARFGFPPGPLPSGAFVALGLWFVRGAVWKFEGAGAGEHTT